MYMCAKYEVYISNVWPGGLSTDNDNTTMMTTMSHNGQFMIAQALWHLCQMSHEDSSLC